MQTEPMHYYCHEVTWDFLLDNCPIEPRFSQYLDIRESHVKKTKATKIITCSLFNKHVGDATGTQKTTVEDWGVKYLDSLKRNLELSSTWDNICVELYCEPSCEHLIVDLVNFYEHVNLHVMKLESNAATGHFWRYLGFDTSRSHESKWVYCVDIDEDWSYSFRIMENHEPCSAVLLEPGYESVIMSENPLVVKYSPVCASFIATHPKLHAYKMRDAICRFWYYQVYFQYHLEPRTVYNAPYGDAYMGFGNNWQYYHSCERFMEKLFYYTQKRSGNLNTVFLKDMLKKPIGPVKADIDFSKKHGNQIFAL